MATSKSVTLCFVLLVALCAAVSLSTSSPMGNSNAELYGVGGPFGEEGAELGAELNANSSPYEKLGSEFVGATSGNDDNDNGSNSNDDNNAATEAEGTVEADIESEADSSSQFSPRTRSSAAADDEESESADSDSLDGQDSNIENARIELTPRDKATASGHHYHGHGVHGMLKMGASTGKKGAFKWHDKHPVGGKGRR